MSDLAERIITELDEPHGDFIRHLVAVAGEPLAERCLQQTRLLLAQGYENADRGGPLQRQDGQPRTKGGTFIYLVRGQMPAEKRDILWPPEQRPPRKRPLWTIVEELESQLAAKAMGEAMIEIELIGRPEKLGNRQGVVSAYFVTEADEEKIPCPCPRSAAATWC